MKVLLILIAGIALCSSVPVVREDNSRYLEDENLPHTRNINIQYRLFTRRNPTNAQTITFGDTNGLLNSFYDNNRPTQVIVHGWIFGETIDLHPLTTDTFIRTVDCNVIVVDWSTIASSSYVTASAAVPDVGQALGEFLQWLINVTGANWNNFHLVGFGLGAHVVGNAGRMTGGRPRRITGLDPAGPLWAANSFALNKNDGQYVEAIHTDGGRMGIFYPLADADFYPNGGRGPEAGCITAACVHNLAVHLFATSVINNGFEGRECPNLESVSNFNLCTGPILLMGNSDLTKRGSGIYALSVRPTWPLF